MPAWGAWRAPWGKPGRWASSQCGRTAWSQCTYLPSSSGVPYLRAGGRRGRGQVKGRAALSLSGRDLQGRAAQTRRHASPCIPQIIEGVDPRRWQRLRTNGQAEEKHQKHHGGSRPHCLRQGPRRDKHPQGQTPRGGGFREGNSSPRVGRQEVKKDAEAIRRSSSECAMPAWTVDTPSPGPSRLGGTHSI